MAQPSAKRVLFAESRTSPTEPGTDRYSERTAGMARNETVGVELDSVVYNPRSASARSDRTELLDRGIEALVRTSPHSTVPYYTGSGRVLG